MRNLRQVLITGNPVFITLAGLSPSLAVTTRVSHSLVLGMVALLVIVLGALVTSLLRTSVGPHVRLPVTLGVLGLLAAIATLITGVVAPGLHAALGIYLPLTAVNCIITSRLQTVAWQSAPGRAVVDALATGSGFLLALLVLALVREPLGSGSITLFPMGEFAGVIAIPWLAEHPVRAMGVGAGGFLLLGYLVALVRHVAVRSGE